MSIVDLLRNGNLDARIAAFFWLAIERRASLVVTSSMQDAGKTTLLTALLDFLPPDIERLYLRGWYERFDFIESKNPSATYLLCNEISDNLPTYLWGPGVQRLFETALLGYPLATTMHADGASAIVDLLTAYPLEVPRGHLACIDFVLTLDGGSRSAGFLRRLMRVETLQATDDAELHIESIAERDVLLGPLATRPGQLIGLLTDRFGLPRQEAIGQLARREQFLEHLVRENAGTVSAENSEHPRDAIRRFAAT
ncbi:MAG TPA: type II secretion system protein E [Dehalococcoidia bacterium]|nr:type II secretion system protein E [Dehalococcoidia bacterium]